MCVFVGGGEDCEILLGLEVFIFLRKKNLTYKFNILFVYISINGFFYSIFICFYGFYEEEV